MSIRIITSPVITRKNYHEAKEFVELAKELGLDSIIFTPLRKKGRAKENIEDLGLTIQEELDFAEQIAQVIHDGTKQHIQLGLGSPLFTEYLNKKYNISLPIIPGGCNSLIQKGFIHPDGSLFPCQEITKYFEIDGIKKYIKKNQINDIGFKNIWNSSDYQDFFKMMFNNEIKNKNNPCNICKYFISFCYPCPLPSIRNKTQLINHDSCLETIKRASKNKIPIDINENIVIDAQTIIHKAVNEPIFRNDLFRNIDDTLMKNRFVMKTEEKNVLTNILNVIGNNVDAFLTNYKFL